MIARVLGSLGDLMLLGYWVHGRPGGVWIILAALTVLTFSIAILIVSAWNWGPYSIDELQGLLD